MTREISEFREAVWGHYAKHGRDLPWRQSERAGNFDVYKILVSEVMLQQTQVNRVIPKYRAWLRRFPTVQSLVDAPLAAALAEWSGLGYNRRAKFLHEASKRLAPKQAQWTFDDLAACKGIGPNTAAAVVVYAYNQPLIFIETNIRTVFIHHFFKDMTSVPDKEILPLVKKTLPVKKGKEQSRPSHYREWYWALMDYGVYLKATFGNLSRQSKHYAKQSAFTGSKRQVRGQVLLLLKHKNFSQAELDSHIADERLGQILSDLLQERLVTKREDIFYLG